MQLDWSYCALVCRVSIEQASRLNRAPLERTALRRKMDLAAELRLHRGLACGGTHSVEVAVVGS